MKKKRITILTIIVILLILFVPIPTAQYKDGGTKEYSALTYKIMAWKVMGYYAPDECIDGDDRYSEVSVYWFPDNFKGYEELWKMEQSK